MTTRLSLRCPTSEHQQRRSRRLACDRRPRRSRRLACDCRPRRHQKRRCSAWCSTWVVLRGFVSWVQRGAPTRAPRPWCRAWHLSSRCALAAAAAFASSLVGWRVCRRSSPSLAAQIRSSSTCSQRARPAAMAEGRISLRARTCRSVWRSMAASATSTSLSKVAATSPRRPAWQPAAALVSWLCAGRAARARASSTSLPRLFAGLPS
mmetsp:Transcript_50319/g.128123  ORF Transcript_50319/g.128123 Transcript_50319/m.128123 type:complete len:207 (+) Transcript_50319:2775-3395(+)